MATGLLALLDDVAMLADDVAVTGKVAVQKTAGVLGDDLAVNAEKATGFDQSRELAIIWAIAKGSFKNKFIILPIAFLLSYFAPFMIIPILIAGALFLGYEGFEKIEELFGTHEIDKSVLETTPENVLEKEKEKIASAIKTDFILSIEIVVIALGTAVALPLVQQIFVVTGIALLATVGVYGIVAGIVRIDNLGFWLMAKKKEAVGLFLVRLMPKIIKFLSYVGMVAMLLVAGGIMLHNLHFMHGFGVEMLPGIVNEFLAGILTGAMVYGLMEISEKLHLAEKVSKIRTKTASLFDSRK